MPTRPSRVRALMTRHPRIYDAATATAMVGCALAVALIDPGNRGSRPIEPSDFGFAVIALIALTIRGRWGQAALLLVIGTMSARAAVTGNGHPILLFSAGIIAYSLASRAPARRTTAQLIAGCALLFYTAMAIQARSVWAPEAIPVLAFLGIWPAFGDATRNRRAYLAEVEERARRAEQTRDEEASRRVIQERLRIARELHDVVAHHIAVINVQAAAASHLLDRRPDQVRPALSHIRDAAGTVLQELSSIVGVLRQSDEDETGSTEPTRGLARLPELLGNVGAAGLDVTHRQVGQARPLPAVVDLAAFRIVQEGLTNAHRYGTGSADLTVTYAPWGIGIEVVNAVAEGAGGSGSGYGIVGMRERAAAADGVLSTRTGPDGRFTVRAELPAPTEDKS